MNSPTSPLSSATTEIEEPFDDEDSDEEAWKFDVESQVDQEQNWGQTDHVSVLKAALTKLDIYHLCLVSKPLFNTCLQNCLVYPFLIC